MNKDKLKKLATFTIECLEEHIPVRGNLVISEDPELDKLEEDQVLAELEWNQWAWCCVKVTAEYAGIEESTYLGGCSYKDQKDFEECGSYEDMKSEALEMLFNSLGSVSASINKLQENRI